IRGNTVCRRKYCICGQVPVSGHKADIRGIHVQKSWSALSQPYYWPLLYLHIIAVLEEELRIVNSDQLLKWQLLLLDVSSCNPDTISSENNGDIKAKDTNF